MATRKPIVGGNWKMNLTGAESDALIDALNGEIGRPGSAETVVFPPFVYLERVAQRLRKAGSAIELGAQDFYHQPNGAFTGEVSIAQLKDLGATWVLAGHSERRHVIGESDDLINRKVHAALDAGLNVILCIGETLEQREKGKTDAINLGQVALGLAGVKAEQMSRVVIAYEPVWAIGTGKTATADDAQATHSRIRAFVRFALYNGTVADALRIQYGGSVKPSNADELFGQPDIDGGLIGGASLKAADFVPIVKAAK
jgi:triosephosphate isomerase